VEVQVDALVTALLSGLVAAIAAYLFTARREHVAMLRTKAEALFLAYDTYDDY
jgi:hypothetical protein